MARVPVPRPEARIPVFDDKARLSAPPGVAVPAVPQPSATLTGGLIARLDRLAGTADAIADRETILSAQEAGTVAGDAAPGTVMEGGGSLYRRAFNRAAEAAAQARLEVEARQTLERLARQHAADPAAFAAATEAWRNGAAATLPEPWRPAFLRRFDGAAIPYLRQVEDNARKAVADEALAAFQAALPARIASIQRAAQRALHDPQAAEALRVEEDALLADLVRLGPPHAFEFEGRRIEADPARPGALSVTQLAALARRIRTERTEALTIAAWRAAGATREWIDAFERDATASAIAPWIVEEAQQARPFAPPERLLQRLPPAWALIAREAAARHGLPPDLLAGLIALESGGQAEAVSRAGAVGPAQVLPATARDPGFGVAPLPEEALTDPARAIPWAAEYLAALRRHFGGDLAKALAAYNAGAGTVERADRERRRLPEETRRYLATLLPLAAEAMPALPMDEARRLAAILRGLAAAEEATQREARAAARAEANRRIAENLAAIEVEGRPVHRLTPEELTAAGFDAAQVLERERAAIERFAAAELARRTTDPAELGRLAEAFRPGTPNFAADPAAAVRLLDLLERRGVTVQGKALAERVRDLTAAAEATGQLSEITDEEAAAAGLTPERRAEINRDLALRAELARLRREAERLPPEDREAMVARFPLVGEGAAANAARVRAVVEAFEERDRAVARDAADYAIQGSREARALMERVTGGDLDALKPLVDLTRALQAEMNIAPAQRRDLPKPLARALLDAVANQPDKDAAWGVLHRLTEAVGVPGVERLAGEWTADGQRRGARENAIIVAAAVTGRDPGLARDLIGGAYVLRDNPLVDATRTNVETAVDRYLGNALALRPDVRAHVRDAALALAAAAAAKAGRLSAPLRPAEFTAHLERIMPVTRYEGATVPLPPGMDEGTFHAVMRALPPERLSGAVAADGRAITPQMLARGGFALDAIGPGRYVLRWGEYTVLDATRPGEAFVLDLNGARPHTGSPPAAPGAESARRPASPRAAVRRIEGFDDE